MYDLLLINACVITVNKAHDVFDKGYVAVKGDHIAAVGPMAELGGQLPNAKR